MKYTGTTTGALVGETVGDGLGVTDAVTLGVALGLGVVVGVGSPPVPVVHPARIRARAATQVTATDRDLCPST
ncbi:hypothetical protein [Cellulomonas sp. WB94]|uniref:hypothetical protein n=1 Tax=Cellulomonas sp. WB94 TaxID=2173174 RepID=UPI001304A37B|nr:hypothetical protein [Cellulomonas sp. WB94]